MIIARPTANLVLPLGDPSDTPATMRVTSPYGDRAGGFHGGIDIGNYVAGDDLIACADMTIIAAGYVYSPWSLAKPSDAWWNAQPLNAATGQRGGLYGPPSRWNGPTWGGRMVVGDLGSGWVASYAHADQILASVVVGARLARGELIGDVGDTGSAYRQPHLHFGLRYEGALGNGHGGWVDPGPLINGGAHPHIEEDMAITLRPVREKWVTKLSTDGSVGYFTTDGPGMGDKKWFTAAETVESYAETADGYRLIAYGPETLWMLRTQLNPIAGTRQPLSGYGLTAGGGFTQAQVDQAKKATADKAEAQTQAWIATRSPIVP